MRDQAANLESEGACPRPLHAEVHEGSWSGCWWAPPLLRAPLWPRASGTKGPAKLETRHPHVPSERSGPSQSVHSLKRWIGTQGAHPAPKPQGSDLRPPPSSDGQVTRGPRTSPSRQPPDAPRRPPEQGRVLRGQGREQGRVSGQTCRQRPGTQGAPHLPAPTWSDLWPPPPQAMARHPRGPEPA